MKRVEFSGKIYEVDMHIRGFDFSDTLQLGTIVNYNEIEGCYTVRQLHGRTATIRVETATRVVFMKRAK